VSDLHPASLDPQFDVSLPEGYVRPVAIGSGGQATVWRASALEGPSPVAIKIFRRGDSHAFYTEMRVALELESPHLPRVYGVEDAPGGGRFLIEEYCAGGNLRCFTEDRIRLDTLETSRVAVHVLRALRVLHGAGMIHGDVKPDNILSRTRRGPRMWVLTDFGVSSRAGNTASRRAFTPAYAAPEQKVGRAEPASDIYCLAVTLLECLHGSLSGDLAIAELPVMLASWFGAALEAEPSARPSLEASLEFWQDIFSEANIEEYATPLPIAGRDNAETEAT
jgi:serine/threonine-protein kinase